MTLTVLDASVAVKWFLTDEPKRDEALAVLDQVAANASQFVVPDLFFVECAAVIARRSAFDARFSRECLAALHDLAIETVPSLGTLLDRALDLAGKHHHSVYDCVYLALAEQTSGKWLTADAAAAKKLRREPLQLL